MRQDLIDGVTVPKIADHVTFLIQTQGPEYDAGILGIAKLLGCIEHESAITNNLSLSIAFKPCMTPRIRKFREYCEHHRIRYTLQE